MELLPPDRPAPNAVIEPASRQRTLPKRSDSGAFEPTRPDRALPKAVTLLAPDAEVAEIAG